MLTQLIPAVFVVQVQPPLLLAAPKPRLLLAEWSVSTYPVYGPEYRRGVLPMDLGRFDPPKYSYPPKVKPVSNDEHETFQFPQGRYTYADIASCITPEGRKILEARLAKKEHGKNGQH